MQPWFSGMGAGFEHPRTLESSSSFGAWDPQKRNPFPIKLSPRTSFSFRDTPSYHPVRLGPPAVPALTQGLDVRGAPQMWGGGVREGGMNGIHVHGVSAPHSLGQGSHIFKHSSLSTSKPHPSVTGNACPQGSLLQ